MAHPSRPADMAHLSLRLAYLALVIAIAFALRSVNLNHLPVSLSLDEAVNGLDALRLFRAAWLTPFLQNNFGRETLFYYLQSLALQLYGISFFSLRFMSVMAGTLTVALLYSLGRSLRLEKLLSGRPPALHLVALLAATGLAISYWHLYFSREALRAILLPPVLLGCLWCFWQGWRPARDLSLSRTWSRRGWLMAAGFLLGLTLYTYLAARLLPVLFAALIATELIIQPASVRKRMGDLLSFGMVAAATATPLAWYFYQHPHAFGSRTQAISLSFSETLLDTLVGNILSILRLHLLGGTWLGQWPALNLLAAAGFLIGLLVCLRRIREPASRLLLIWWGLGMAPTALSQQNWQAVTPILRSIAAWPAIYLISAVGLAQLAAWISKWVADRGRLIPAASPKWLIALPCLVLIVDGLSSAHNYFAIWATTYDADDEAAYLAHYLNAQTRRLSLIPLKFYTNPGTGFLLQARYPTLRELDAESLPRLLESHAHASPEPIANIYVLPDGSIAESSFALLVPSPTGSGTAYLLPPLTLPQIKALSDYTTATRPLAVISNRANQPLAQVYPLDARAPFLPERPIPMQPLDADFNNDIRLVGYHLEPAWVKPGETVTLYLKWQVQRLIEGDYYLFLHLVDVFPGQRRGQINIALNSLAYYPFRAPDRPAFTDVYYFSLPPDSPEGVYLFEAGLYHNMSLQRLPVTWADASQPPGDQVILGKFHVQRTPPAPPSTPINATFGDRIALLGADFSSQRLHPGQTFTYTLHWQAVDTMAQDYTVFNHLVDEEGRIRAQQDSMPQANRYPTSMWDRAEVVLDPRVLPVPPDLEPGRYALRIGLYRVESGERLPVKHQPTDWVELPGFTVSAGKEN